MQKELRHQFNSNFSAKKYSAYEQELENLHPGTLEFRNAETPASTGVLWETVGDRGLEPLTSTMSTLRSNQLS